MNLALDHTSLWRQEYDAKGIPSSFRSEPSGSVEDFLLFLREHGLARGTVVDLGAGTGRNSVFLAGRGYNVTAFELVPELVEQINVTAAALDLNDHIGAFTQNVCEPWPLSDNSCDIAIDTFCYKHQIRELDKSIYRKELRRVLRPKGYYLLTLAGKEDGYYGAQLSSSPDRARGVIVDPFNGIPSVLYSREELEEEFQEDFKLVSYTHKQNRTLMHGEMYDRSTHVFIFQRWRKKEQPT